MIVNKGMFAVVLAIQAVQLERHVTILRLTAHDQGAVSQ